ncbi:MAG: hypothetical protein KF767_09355 [Bdellovibrionaceae bacterium]|nr:hypothetical protein [Pseudobdellovibrionaceae bacterium]
MQTELSLSTKSAAEINHAEVIHQIRQDYEFGLFCLLPGFEGQLRPLLQAAQKLGLTERKIELYSRRLFDAGLWTLDGNNIQAQFDYLELGDIDIQEYLAMTVCIVSRLSQNKSYEFDTLSLVTNRTLIRNFVSKVNSGLKELYAASKAEGAARDCVFSWTHTGVIELEKKPPVAKSGDEE